VDMSPRFDNQVFLDPGSTIVLYTDGLVERRDDDLDSRIHALERLMDEFSTDVGPLPRRLLSSLCPSGSADDVAILVARVPSWFTSTGQATIALESTVRAPSDARRFATEILQRWGVGPKVTDDLVLMTSELVTNAVDHGAPPVALHLASTSSEVLLEVEDGGSRLPRLMHPGPTEPRGRGVSLVSSVATSWGTRRTSEGKVVWCVRSLLDSED
jgi:anti-sigma regulatory factor (Ser/Thr protein kinase)